MHTVFSDEIVQATELKRNQRHWFDRARQVGGLTIVQGKQADLVLAPRAVVAAHTRAAYYARLMGQFFLETVGQERASGSAVFPWLADLDQDDQLVFRRAIARAFADCSATNRWEELDELLEDWQATAQANRNPDLMAAWRSRGRPEDYAPLEPPHAG